MYFQNGKEIEYFDHTTIISILITTSLINCVAVFFLVSLDLYISLFCLKQVSACTYSSLTCVVIIPSKLTGTSLRYRAVKAHPASFLPKEASFRLTARAASGHNLMVSHDKKFKDQVVCRQ